MDLQILKPRLANYYAIDCVVDTKDMIYYLMVEDYRPQLQAGLIDQPPGDRSLKKRLIRHPLNQKASEVKHAELTGFYHTVVNCALSYEPQAVPIVIDGVGNVWARAPGTSGIEDDLKYGAIVRAKSLGGPVICCSNARDMLIRKGVNLWERLGNKMPSSKKVEDYKYQGFEDFDAFAMNDIYAVGGLGDVWHFDGQLWRQIDFPCNWGPSAVCCAGDGYVYIGLSNGAVYKGRQNEWEMIHNDDMTVPFQDMVWYQGKVWCTSDYGIWTIENDQLEEADVPSSVVLCAGHLSTRDGILLVAGLGGVAYHDGQKWTRLFSQSEINELP